MVRDYLQKQKQLKDIYVTKVHLSMGDSSQRQKTWSTVHSLQEHSAQPAGAQGTACRSTVHSLQAAPQIEEFPFQVPQLVWASYRQLSFSLILPNWSMSLLSSFLFCILYLKNLSSKMKSFNLGGTAAYQREKYGQKSCVSICQSCSSQN